MLTLQHNSEQIKNVFLEKLFFIFDSWYTGKNNIQELDKVNFINVHVLYNIPLTNKFKFIAFIDIF